MPSDKIQFPSDPIFNDYLYTILYNAPISQKRNLKGKYQKAAMSEKAAKTFIQTASLEDKIYMLCELGHSFFFTLMKDDFKVEYLKDILTDFEKDNKTQGLKSVLEKGVFVSSDVTFNRLLGYVSRAIHHHSFYLDMEMQRQGWNVKKWSKRAFTQRDLDFREMDEGATELARSFLSAAITMDYCKGSVGVTHQEMKILLYLYTQSHTFISEKHLTDYFHGYIRGAEIRLGIRNLWKSNNIEQDKGIEKRYTITGSGTRCVSNFFKTVFSKTNQ